MENSIISFIKNLFDKRPEYMQLRFIKEHQKIKAIIRSCKTPDQFKVAYEFTHDWVDRVVLDKKFKHADPSLSASLAINALQYLEIKAKELNESQKNSE